MLAMCRILSRAVLSSGKCAVSNAATRKAGSKVLFIFFTLDPQSGFICLNIRSPFMSRPNTRPEKQGKLGNFFLFAAVLLMMLALGEVVSRKMMPESRMPDRPQGWAVIPEESWVEYDSDLGWFHQKNKSAFLEKNELRIPVTTNDLGLRGAREYALAKPGGISRLYAAGDSFTFGFGVQDNETWPAQMEQMRSGLQVMNLGVADYGIDQIRLLLEKFGYAYAPDIVIVAVYPEDFWRATRAFNDAGHGKPWYRLNPDGTLALQHHPVPKDKNFSTVQFPEVMSRSPAERVLSHSALYRLSLKAAGRLRKSLGHEDPDTSREWLLGRAILKQMVQEIRSHGVEPVIAIVPPRRWITGTDEPVRQSLIRFGEREAVTVIDLTQVFRKASAEKGVDALYIPDDHHWTVEGNRLAAETILGKLHLDSGGQTP